MAIKVWKNILPDKCIGVLLSLPIICSVCEDCVAMN